MLFAVAASVFVWRFLPNGAATLPQELPTPVLFSMSSTAGGTFTEADLVGAPSLVFFGYTFCPDVCPTTMAQTVLWREQLALPPEALRTIFVSIDPERDTPERLKEYLAAFDPAIVGLVGTADETKAIESLFAVLARKSDKGGDGENYLMNHTASVFLVGRDGSFQGTIGYGEANAPALAKIKRLVS